MLKEIESDNSEEEKNFLRRLRKAQDVLNTEYVLVLDPKTKNFVRKDKCEKNINTLAEQYAEERYPQYPDSGLGYTLHDPDYEDKIDAFMEGVEYALKLIYEEKET